MADIKSAIKTGVLGTTDLAQAIQLVEAEAPTPKEGELCYETVPSHNPFNTTLSNGQRIKFVGGRFTTKKQTEIDWLEQFVESGVIRLVEPEPAQLELDKTTDEKTTDEDE